MRSRIKNIINNSTLEGSIEAILKDLRSLLFNIKSLVIHIKNYYLLSRKVPVERKLHFGCGSDYRRGFINLDMRKSADYYFDARNKLPFRDKTIEYIYSSHFVEHLSNEELMKHFKESFRVLQAGGIYRICIPDFEKYIKFYIQRDYEWLETAQKYYPLNYCFIPKHLYSYADYLDRTLHESGSHKTFLDYEKTKNMLIHSGFQEANINLVGYDPFIDLRTRREHSFYMVAMK